MVRMRNNSWTGSQSDVNLCPLKLLRTWDLWFNMATPWYKPDWCPVSDACKLNVGATDFPQPLCHSPRVQNCTLYHRPRNSNKTEKKPQHSWEKIKAIIVVCRTLNYVSIVMFALTEIAWPLTKENEMSSTAGYMKRKLSEKVIIKWA